MATVHDLREGTSSSMQRSPSVVYNDSAQVGESIVAPMSAPGIIPGNIIQSNPMSSDGRRNSSMPASQIHTQIQIGRSPVPVRLALKS